MYNYGKEEERRKRRVQVTFLAILMGVSLIGCSPRIATPKIEYIDRVEYRDHYIRDTIHETHTEYIYARNDTIFQEITKEIYRERIIQDTVLVEKTDSIPYEVTVTEYVDKHLKQWQVILMLIGVMTILAILIYAYIKLKKIWIR